MLSAPYSVYINKRPLRVAFLIENTPESLAIIDAIFAYNRDRWGGRYHPIVITDGQTLTDAWWELLEAVDPDVVQSFVALSDDLLTGIDRRVSPYLIKQDDEHQCINLPDNGLSPLPTPSNVRMASLPISEPSLVLFETDHRKTDARIKRFVEWNFGGYSNSIRAVSHALEGVVTQPYKVTDASSLVTPLAELATFRDFTYPIQLCSVPREALPEVNSDRFGETFHVVIGDTPTDAAYFWNLPATIPQWRRAYLNQVWFPHDVATNPELADALSSWLQRSADPSGSHQGRIRFVSLSLSQEQLQKVVEPLTRNLRVRRDVNALGEIQPPQISKCFLGSPGQDKMDLYRVTGTKERLTLQEPDVLAACMVCRARRASLDPSAAGGRTRHRSVRQWVCPVARRAPNVLAKHAHDRGVVVLPQKPRLPSEDCACAPRRSL